MKVLLIGNVASSLRTLNVLLDFSELELVGIVTTGQSSINADFEPLGDHAKQVPCPVFYTDQENSKSLSCWITELDPEVIFCIGWSYLLPQEIINIPRSGVIGYHPAKLPQHRGRHPIIWSLVMGLDELGSTLFMIDEGADSGDIVNQKNIDILDADDAGTLYEKMLETLDSQLREVIRDLLADNLRAVPQNNDVATYWRKRNKDDGRIDWRMPAQGIHNLVRGLTKPYPGAHCENSGQEIKIWSTRIVIDDRRDIEPGKVLSVQSGCITVKCGVDAIELVDHGFIDLPLKGDYL